jgi:hypothetical protein
MTMLSTLIPHPLQILVITPPPTHPPNLSPVLTFTKSGSANSQNYLPLITAVGAMSTFPLPTDSSPPHALMPRLAPHPPSSPAEGQMPFSTLPQPSSMGTFPHLCAPGSLAAA